MRDEHRIDLSDTEGVRSWTLRLGITEEDLAEIVHSVGNNVDNVREHVLMRTSGAARR